jgi:hypothetical protein
LRKRYYLIKGTLHNVKEHEYSGDELFWIHGNIIKSADAMITEDESQEYYRRQKNNRADYGIRFRSLQPRKIAKKETNNRKNKEKRFLDVRSFFGIKRSRGKE